jgi:hemerythrin
MLNWNPGLTTGIPILDFHHRQIIEQFNNFHAALSRGESEKRTEAGRILDYLLFYAAWHFQREEAYMDRYRCPAAEANRRAHAEFLRRFGEFYRLWQTQGMSASLANDTFIALMEWIVNHIQGIDTQLSRSVAGK